MADVSALPLSVRALLKVYRWRRISPIPVTPLKRPLAQSRVALVTSGGLVVPGETPFDQDVRGGDYSYRVIPNDVDVQTLEEHHRSESFDHSGIEADKNMAFPLERFRELEAEGIIGELAPRHLSFMGSLTATGRLTRDTAPEAAELLVQDGVEVAFLVPV